ncbi:hypothetical protein [Kitasatospora indigofera]|uniref:hypothetical protein n=1 Tax=Kitasatospora indigofera TaxID=67307 RepID=UPI00339FF304
MPSFLEGGNAISIFGGPLHRCEATTLERAFVVWLTQILGRVPAPSSGEATRRMDIAGATRSRLFQGERAKGAAVTRLREGANEAGGRARRPAMTLDEYLEGLALVSAVLRARRVRESAHVMACRMAKQAELDMGQVAMVRTQLETPFGLVACLLRTLAVLEGDLTVRTVEEVEVLAEAWADLAGTCARLAKPSCLSAGVRLGAGAAEV